MYLIELVHVVYYEWNSSVVENDSAAVDWNGVWADNVLTVVID